MNDTLILYDLLIIGGGAAGFFAASNAARGQRILILEKARLPMGKVRISGGGRCNVTNACFDPWRLVENYPRGGPELLGCFTRFQPWDTMNWFEAHDVPLKIEGDGRVFPASNRSASIVDCLLAAAQETGTELMCQAAVIKIEVLPEEIPVRFQVQVRIPQIASETVPVSRNQPEITLSANNILLATGGDGHGLALASSLGHTIISPVPSLFTFQVQDPRLEGLAGLSVPLARVRLYGSHEKAGSFEQEGALLITHWGLSGPVVLRCSARGARWLYEHAYHADLEINWLHPNSLEQTLASLHETKANNQRRSILSHNPFPTLPMRLWQRLAASTNIQEPDKWADLSKKALLRLAQELCTSRFEVNGKGLFKDEFVTCGGVRLAEVDFKTMQSKLVPGLYFAGEILDIDGLTGGFNFQNAWTNAYLAIQAINREWASRNFLRGRSS